MPRNKSTKRARKQQKSSNPLVGIQKMEMDWLKAPAKMAAQLAKQIQINEKQESKLNKAVKKINAQANKAEAKVESAVAKKQIKIATKKLDAIVKAQSDFNKQLQMITNTLDGLNGTRSRLNALQKCIHQFNADWNKAAKNANSNKKQKNRPKLTPVKKQPLHSIETLMETPVVDELAS